MTRRSFLSRAGVAAAAQEYVPERIEKMTAAPKPAMALNHLGFLPGARKVLIYRLTGGAAPAEFSMRDISGPRKPFQITRPLKKVSGGLGDCLAGDFSDIEREGMYQVSVGDERSVPFFIRPDLWRRTLPKAVAYFHAQRCGVAVPNVHPVCHLDDARRRDNGQHVDVTGGWHDAGDLRKWMSATMMIGIALMRLAENLGESWDLAGSGLAPLLDEMRWGNRYFLKMQDTDGLVWADTAGGVNGDNSDNHWTDNQTGTGDDRYINPAKSGRTQAMFIALQALVSQVFRKADPAYREQCLSAALRCWKASKAEGETAELGWWVQAAASLYRATGDKAFHDTAAALGQRLLSLQTTDFSGSQKVLRGFWRNSSKSSRAYSSETFSALPPVALLDLAATLPEHSGARQWRDAARMYLDEYVLPLTARSAYRIMPYSVFTGAPSPDFYRPLAGELTYRYFMPVRFSSSGNPRRSYAKWMGLTSHLESHALLLAMAAETFHNREYRDLACRQLEWVMGANPFGACLMTGEGMRNVYPHSRFVGLLPGGIVNGIAGDLRDEPVLDTEYGYDWRTTEYWSPHNAFYIWTLSVLEKSHRDL